MRRSEGAPFRRGVSLALKFSLSVSLLILLLTVLFSMVVTTIVKRTLEDESVRYGQGQAYALRAWGRRVYESYKASVHQGQEYRASEEGQRAPERLKDETYRKSPAGQEALEYFEKKDDGTWVPKRDSDRYRESPQGQQDHEFLLRLRKNDPRIREIRILFSDDPKEAPRHPLVYASDLKSGWTEDEEVFRSDEMLAFRGKYKGVAGFEPALFFRVCLEDPPTATSATAGLVLSSREIDDRVGALLTRVVTFGLVFVVIGIVVSLMLAYLVTSPLKQLTRDMAVVAGGDLDHVTVPQTRDEIGRMAAAFDRMTQGLKEAQLRDREVERLNSDLHMAKEVHAKLLPEKVPEIPGYDIASAYLCAREVGGDYYDFFGVDQEHLGIVVADVSGKGIPGSMVMGTTRVILRMMAAQNPSPADVLVKTNFHVARMIKRGMFVTALYLVLNVRTRTAAVASAGHNPMILWRASTRLPELIRPGGIALGFDRGTIFDRTIREQQLALASGDRVVLYTDGVTEAMNEQRQEWGEEALLDFVSRHAEEPSTEFIGQLMETLDRHKGAAEQHDDITVTTFRIGNPT